MKVIEWVEKNLGAIDILINNAAINIDITLQNDEVLDWKKIFDVNLLGLTCMIQEVLKLMKKKGKISLLKYNKYLKNYDMLYLFQNVNFSYSHTIVFSRN